MKSVRVLCESRRHYEGAEGGGQFACVEVLVRRLLPGGGVRGEYSALLSQAQ